MICHKPNQPINQLYKRNLCDRWIGTGTVIRLENKQVLVKHAGSYVRVHPSCLVLYPETYQNSLENGKIGTNTSHKRPDELPKVSISEDIDIDEDLETPNNNVDRSPKQNFIPKKIELLKQGKTIKCKLANDKIQNGENWMF